MLGFAVYRRLVDINGEATFEDQLNTALDWRLMGLGDRIEKVAADLDHPEADLAKDNPLGKVPTLVLDDGTALIESPLICEWLEAEGNGKLIPRDAKARTAALQLQAFGDGIGEAAICVQRERNRTAKSAMKSAIKAASGQPQDAAKTRDALSLVARTAKRGIIHKRKASRLASRLQRRVNAAKAAAPAS